MGEYRLLGLRGRQASANIMEVDRYGGALQGEAPAHRNGATTIPSGREIFVIKLRGLQRVGLAAVMLLALVVLAACGGGGGGGASDNGGGAVADGEVEVVLTEYAFTPNNIEVAVGKPVTFVMKNEGSLEHDMAFDDLDTVSDLVSAGDTATFEVTFEEAGTYPFYCTVPGHREAGMEGTVTAK